MEELASVTGVTASGLVSEGLLLSMLRLSVTAELTTDATVGDRDTVGRGLVSAMSEGAAVLAGLPEDWFVITVAVSVGTILVSVVVTVTVKGVTVTVVVDVVVLEVRVEASVMVRVDSAVSSEGAAEATVLETGWTTDAGADVCRTTVVFGATPMTAWPVASGAGRGSSRTSAGPPRPSGASPAILVSFARRACSATVTLFTSRLLRPM